MNNSGGNSTEKYEDSESVNLLEVRNEGVVFNGQIINCTVESGVARFDFKTEASDQVHTLEMDATTRLNQESEFELFLQDNNLTRETDVLENLPVDCTVVTERVNDEMTFRMRSISEHELNQSNVFVEEFPTLAFGLVAGLVPITNILLFSVIAIHNNYKTEDILADDVVFLSGMVLGMIISFVFLFTVII